MFGDDFVLFEKFNPIFVFCTWPSRYLFGRERHALRVLCGSLAGMVNALGGSTTKLSWMLLIGVLYHVMMLKVHQTVYNLLYLSTYMRNSCNASSCEAPVLGTRSLTVICLQWQ